MKNIDDNIVTLDNLNEIHQQNLFQKTTSKKGKIGRVKQIKLKLIF